MNLLKTTINAISYTNLKKDGTEIKNKWGKTSWRTGIQVPEHGQTWLNGFLPFEPKDWKDTVREIEVYEEEYNGVKKLAFRLPKPDAQNPKALEEVLNKLTFMNLKLDELLAWKREVTGDNKAKIPGTTEPYPEPGDEGLEHLTDEDLASF
jgi:hypothetical protein